MKIFYICYEEISGYNGATRHIAEISKNLQKLGHEVQLCAPLIKGPVMSYPVPVKSIPTLGIRFLRATSYAFLSLFYLPFFIIKFKPDILYVRSLPITPLPVLLSKIFRIPCILEVNGLVENKNSRNKILNILLSLFQKIEFRLCNRIIAVSHDLKSLLSKLYGIADKTDVVSIGVDPEDLSPIDKSTARRMVGLEPDGYYVGYVGGFFPWHGLESLIESASIILNDFTNLSYVFVGDGQTRSSIYKQIQERGLGDRFIFTGRVPFSEVCKYISAFDICVNFYNVTKERIMKNGTEYIGNPTKLYEYLACERPVIISEVYNDVIGKLAGTLSVNSSDPKEVSDAIIKLISDKSLAEQMSKDGREEVIKNHSWLAMAKETEKVLRDVLNK
ncbi:MAG: glycosyltransferase family 4 protein [Proteobacteria bacterium]|nr:glycosyltransferase family 4 protein [Pseudomonadota bacterium]